MRLLCALALLAHAAGQLTTASKGVGSGVCFVGPYGWSCDPDDFAFASTLGQASAAPTVSGASSTAAQLATAPACSANCTDDGTPPGPPACALQKFEARAPAARLRAAFARCSVDGGATSRHAGACRWYCS